MSRKVSIEQMADAIEEELLKYNNLAADEVKKAVKKAGKTTKNDINGSAPVRTGKYAKSWRSKVTAEDSQSISVTVHSPTRYMLAHLLEHGHAKRGGGRVRAIPHIAPAEEHATTELVRDIENALKG
ncbi:MAG: HK97 gp10 family phage protein [Lachnospiraceae bacterium]|nr:HK97 gp10 family phage protein [Lachnospiraceae bacterium]